MTTREAVQKLVAYVDEAPAYDELAEATRIVLRDFKAQNIVGLELERIVHEVIKATEAPVVPFGQELFDTTPAPRHPHGIGGKP